MRRHLLALAAFAAAAIALPAPAVAGAPGTWTRLTDPATGGSTEWSSLARTADGVLHVAWRRGNVADPNRDDLVHTAGAPERQRAERPRRS